LSDKARRKITTRKSNIIK